jgi:spore maturation protein SpmB
MVGYYDYVLGLIPAALAGITLALTVSGLNLMLALPMASLVAVGLIGHAMFVRTPVSVSQSSTNAMQTSTEATFQSAD